MNTCFLLKKFPNNVLKLALNNLSGYYFFILFVKAASKLADVDETFFHNLMWGVCPEKEL